MAAPTPAVRIGIAPALLLEVPVTLAPAPAPVPDTVVGAVTPLVNGMLPAEEEPENAGAWVVAVALGVADVLLGLRTLSNVSQTDTLISEGNMNILINDMDDTIRNQQVWSNHSS